MILSMKPPYDISPKILKLISSISVCLGEVNANYLNKQTPQLRKQNKIKTIHSSLSMEGNTLSIEQVSALIDHKKVLGPKKDILEVQNAIKVYDALHKFNPSSSKSFLNAHKILMLGLLQNAGSYRKQSVGIVQGKNVAHLAPPFQNVPALMEQLFNYLKSKDELTLIKSCVFHYEMEFIHPFLDGNGRMGRLWQTLILVKEFPVFEFLPFETMVHASQVQYYQALSSSDKEGKSTIFIEYMLEAIYQSLAQLLTYTNRIMSDRDRLAYFLQVHQTAFTRKEYMQVFKDISSATASRDLLKGTALQLIKKVGEKNKTSYLPILN